MILGRSLSFGFFKSRIVLAIVIFLLAFGVRVLSWHDTRLEAGKVQTAVTADYERVAQLLREGGLSSFLSSSSPLADLYNLGHPPGYSIALAIIHGAFGQSDAAVQFVQITADALSAVLIFLIVANFLPLSAGVIAGTLAAFSPQLAWNSVLLLPDSISVLPILAAIYLLTRAARNPRLVTFLIAGALVGISCWLRANAMLLTIFVAAAVPFLISNERQTAGEMLAKRRQDGTPAGLPRWRPRDIGAWFKWRFALAIVCGTLLIVLPMTIRNAIVFHRFIPISLGAGQTLLEGIADYDTEGRFGIPRTDIAIMKQEADTYQRPDYYGTLLNPDGVERERARLARGFGVIRSHPLWFAGVMARRAASMLRLERSRLISTESPISHAPALANLKPVWRGTPEELSFSGIALSPGVKVSSDASTHNLVIVGDDSKNSRQFSSNVVDVKSQTDFVFSVPIKIERGRMRVSVIDPRGASYSSAIVETIEETTPEHQPTTILELPFVPRSNQRVQLVFSNEASNPPNPVAKIGTIDLYELGPARFLWTRYPRLVVHGIQKIFLTAVMLPLAIIGLLVLIFQKQSRALIVLTIVPLYFFTVQSIVHTEYRYVLAVDYFLFALVGVSLSKIGAVAGRRAASIQYASLVRTPR